MADAMAQAKETEVAVAVVATKTCVLCGVDKPVILFPTDQREDDGRSPVCGLCIGRGERAGRLCSEGLHRMTPENTRTKADGTHACKACSADKLRRNRARKALVREACKRGHDLADEANVYLYRGKRMCKLCHFQRTAERRAKAKRDRQTSPAMAAFRRELADCRSFDLPWERAFWKAQQQAMLVADDPEAVRKSLYYRRAQWRTAYLGGKPFDACGDGT